MKGKKLHLILSAFSSKEMRDFCDFVQSPYFNKSTPLITFAAYLAEQHPHFPEDVFELSSLPPALLPNEELTDKRISYLISGLQQLVERFLVVDRLKEKSHLHEYMCINALRDKNLRELYHPRLNRYVEQMKQPEVYHREQMVVRFMAGDVLADSSDNKLKKVEESLQIAIDNLFELFLINILRYACANENRQTIQFIQPAHIPLIEELEPYFQQYSEKNPVIDLQYALFRCLREPEKDEYFDRLRVLLPQHQHYLGRRPLRIIYMATINISLRKMRTNPQKYTQTTLDLYTKGIDSKVLLDAGLLSEWTFNNTAKLALRAGKISWTENFVNNYYSLVLKDYQKNILGLNRAEIAFAQNDFHQVLEHLNDVSTTSIRYHVLVNILRIKALWELDEMNPAIAALAAFKVYLSRTRGIAPPIKKGAQNFCQALHRISVGGSAKKREDTLQFITTSSLIIDREWLLKTYRKENRIS